MEVGYPIEFEELLMLYADEVRVVGMRPSLYVYVPAEVIQSVVKAHGDIVIGHLPPLTTNTRPPRAAAAAARVTLVPPPEVVENGIKWAVLCQPASSSPEEEGVGQR